MNSKKESQNVHQYASVQYAPPSVVIRKVDCIIIIEAFCLDKWIDKTVTCDNTTTGFTQWFRSRKQAPPRMAFAISKIYLECIMEQRKYGPHDSQSEILLYVSSLWETNLCTSLTSCTYEWPGRIVRLLSYPGPLDIKRTFSLSFVKPYML